MIETQEDLLGDVTRVLEANGYRQLWVKISTAGLILSRYRKDSVEFTLAFEEMERQGVVLPDVSDLKVD